MPIFFHLPKTFSLFHSLLLTESPLASYFSISGPFCLPGTAPGLHVCLTRALQDHSAPCFALIPPSQGLIAPSPGLIRAPRVWTIAPSAQERALAQQPTASLFQSKAI